MKKHYFKVKYGYSTSDQVSITTEDLEKAIYAQIKGVPIQLGTAYINGRNIISITPHYHKHTGWYDYYEPQSGEDWEQIKRDCPDYTGIVEHYKERVSYLLQNGKENLIGKNTEIPGLELLKVKN
jgi:hypothetical protein